MQECFLYDVFSLFYRRSPVEVKGTCCLGNGRGVAFRDSGGGLGGGCTPAEVVSPRSLVEPEGKHLGRVQSAASGCPLFLFLLCWLPCPLPSALWDGAAGRTGWGQDRGRELLAVPRVTLSRVRQLPVPPASHRAPLLLSPSFSVLLTAPPPGSATFPLSQHLAVGAATS